MLTRGYGLSNDQQAQNGVVLYAMGTAQGEKQNLGTRDIFNWDINWPLYQSHFSGNATVFSPSAYGRSAKILIGVELPSIYPVVSLAPVVKATSYKVLVQYLEGSFVQPLDFMNTHTFDLISKPLVTKSRLSSVLPAFDVSSAVLMDNKWTTELSSRIRRFANLPRNWDSYQAKPISPLAVSRALATLAQLAATISEFGASLKDVPFIAPLSNGGIVFELKNGDRELTLEVPVDEKSDYEICKTSIDAQGNSIEEDRSISDSGLPEVFSWIALPS